MLQQAARYCDAGDVFLVTVVNWKAYGREQQLCPILGTTQSILLGRGHRKTTITLAELWIQNRTEDT
jgi:hypothetical protein